MDLYILLQTIEILVFFVTVLKIFAVKSHVPNNQPNFFVER